MSQHNYDFNDKLNFLGEWFDYDTAYQKKFIISFYPYDNTIEIYDKEARKMYLKRTKSDEICMEDMFVGNTVRIYSRQIKLTGYGDCFTQKYIGKMREKTLAILKPTVIDKLGKIINIIQENNFHISKLRMCHLTTKEALDFYAKIKGDTVLPFILEVIVSGPIVALELVGENAVQRWQDLMGPDNPVEARKTSPNSLRAIYGQDSRPTNGFHGSNTVEDGITESDFFFSNQDVTPTSIVTLENSTCCVIKPHAIQEGKLGNIITSIMESHFLITGAVMLYLSKANADEFLEVYKGVVSDYNALLLSFLDGPCVVLGISGKNNEMNVHEEFRRFAGPSDADIAKQIRPNSLRAKYGCDKYKNAVHCTDLPEDTVIELEYIFKVLKDY
ncbi:nucleoside diphosphate kinase 7 [Diorhabda carinulata]|uniref:nucleoside diphosphate kinase 7 n=1 Tax=Diorhabda carinulata TaxID=1163345 RepID=UPI0025A2E3AF|nr:nucleoside diphosphate kinase 7 [Diorhabda carinulata]